MEDDQSERQDAAARLDPEGKSAWASRITEPPKPLNERVAAEAQSAVAALLGQKAEDAAEDAAADPRVALGAGAAGGAPFLARLLRREGAWLAPRWARSPEAAFWELAADLAAAGASAPDHAAFGAAMRVARRRLALTAALADLGSVWDLDATTAALTLFAEAAVSAVLTRLLREEAASGAMPSLDPERSGVFALAMGKMGAFELNYSSDVDLILLYDESRLAAADRARAPERFAKLARDFIRLLSRVDAEGYVARVDLRLRPDPGATPPVVSTASALRYYQTQGRAWERAAHVKARVCAGDRGAGAAYLEALRPFVWRRRVDFAAIEDAAEMLAKIRAHEGGGAVAFAGQDVKLGAGGIREIEFLAQSHQLISGGREPALRAPGTRAVLALLAEAGRIAPETAMALDEAYLHLRRLEHRIQMVEDQQTHRVPKDAEGRARLAGLFGDEPNAAGAARLEARTLAAMRAVREAASPNFDAAPAPKPSEAEAALMEAAAGFAEPARAVAIAQGWFRKDYRALRHERARARLSRLAPEILSRLGAAADPQRALGQFDRFLAGLPAGVRVLAMLEADDAVLDLVAEICAAAPRLAQRLAQKSQLLDAAMDRDFYAAPPGLEARLDELRPRLTREGGEDYERVLDAARRWAAERRFQIGACLLKGEIAPEAAGRAYSDVAEAALRGLWPYVLGAQEARAGAAPGRGAAVLALGRLGSREMTAGSDLDLIVVYDAESADVSDGPKPTPAPQFYARLTQALTLALSAPTAEGPLYEVDMRLRPSGRAGPLATSLAAFRRYQREEAWTWEHMALTRARVVAGDDGVAAATLAAAREALGRERDPAAAKADALAMRARLDEAHPKDLRDPWALKHVRGGLVDLEYIAQVGLLLTTAPLLGVDGGAGLEALRESGALAPEEAGDLIDAWRLMSGMLALTRVAVEGPFQPEQAGSALMRILRRCAGADSDAALEARLQAAQTAVRASFARRIG